MVKLNLPPQNLKVPSLMAVIKFMETIFAYFSPPSIQYPLTIGRHVEEMTYCIEEKYVQKIIKI